MKDGYLIKTIATILAKQYWNGLEDGRKGKHTDLTNWPDYLAVSLLNWLDAARGVIDLTIGEKQSLPIEPTDPIPDGQETPMP